MKIWPSIRPDQFSKFIEFWETGKTGTDALNVIFMETENVGEFHTTISQNYGLPDYILYNLFFC